MKKLIIAACIAIAFMWIMDITPLHAIKVEVTEKVPGASCSGSNGKYTCNVWTGFSAVTQTLGGIIKYFTYIAALGAVLFLVINGVLYSMAGIDEGLKSGAKERVKKTLMGLILLMLSWVILNILAPWVYR